MMNNKRKIISFALILLCVNFVFAKPIFSLSWENSFLTGKINVKDELPEEIIEITETVKGGQSLFVLRCRIIDYISIGAGGGAFINKLNFYYDEWYKIVPDSLPMFYIPIFGELRGQFPILKERLYIYGSAKLGGSISPPKVSYYGSEYSFASGLFFEPMLGFSLNVRRFLLDLGAGYHLQKSKLIDDYHGDIDEYSFDLHQFAVKLGLGVKFGKK